MRRRRSSRSAWGTAIRNGRITVASAARGELPPGSPTVTSGPNPAAGSGRPDAPAVAGRRASVERASDMVELLSGEKPVGGGGELCWYPVTSLVRPTQAWGADMATVESTAGS